jgi:hypothetical protein
LENKTYTPALDLHREDAEVLDYLRDDYRQFGMQEIARHDAIRYFLPLVRELFSSNESKTRIVFTMLQRLMLDDRVRWTRGEIDELFHWLKDGHRNYILHRLSNVGWLEYFRDQSMYMVSDKGEALMRILNRFAMGPELVENEGAALAEIEFSQMLDHEDVSDQLHYLSNRLRKHIIRAEHALESKSAYLILEIYQQLKSAYRWAGQTREALDRMNLEDDDVRQWNEVRTVHDHLSQLHALISRMQLELQDIQRKQIDIAQYGLTHLDFDRYLVHADIDDLADLACKHFNKIPHSLFILETNAFAEAEYTLGRDRAHSSDARGWDTDVYSTELKGEEVEPREALEFTAALKKTGKKWASVEKIVSEDEWDVTAYRFQLLTMIADVDFRMARTAEAALDPIIGVPVEVDFDQSGEMVEVKVKDETRVMSSGRIRRTE